MTDGRPKAPFGVREVTVKSRRPLGEYIAVTVEDPDGRLLRPAQFHMLSAGGAWGSSPAGRPYLPRAVSYLSSDGNGEIEFLLDVVGPGTQQLASLDVGDIIKVVGPLGNGFDDPDEDLRTVLVAGGIGLAPVLAYAERLNGSGRRYDLLLGFRSAGHAEAAAGWNEAILATDDGSVGAKGSVLGPLKELLDEEPCEVFACGPPGMLDAVREACEAVSTPSWLALESPMACGFGSCFGCAVETKEGIIRLCVDGPVVAGSALAGVSSTGRIEA